MASLVKSLVVANQIKSQFSKLMHFRQISCSPMYRAGWNKDWKPGPHPETEADYVAAAKKYGLRRDDYEPYPDDGMGFGDYPKLTPVTGHLRDPYYDWDLPGLQRNYGEPMLAKADIYNQERVDPNDNPPYSYPVMFACFFGVMGTLALAYILMEPYPIIHPRMDKQFPYTADGQRQIHYTFEPAES